MCLLRGLHLLLQDLSLEMLFLYMVESIGSSGGRLLVCLKSLKGLQHMEDLGLCLLPSP